jgi:hypothetical protein
VKVYNTSTNQGARACPKKDIFFKGPEVRLVIIYYKSMLYERVQVYTFDRIFLSNV